MSAPVPRERRRVRRVRLAALLVSAGLLVESISLSWSHPTAFLVFMLGGGTLIAGGVLMFLTTLMSTGPDRQAQEPPHEPR